MRSLILAFSGPIGSGKSTLAKRVAQSLGWKYVSFGDYIREVAHKRGLGTTREELQCLGAYLIEEEGWATFCNSVLNQADWSVGQNIVVDGIRHVEALETLRDNTIPSNAFLIFVDLSGQELEARRSGREALNNLSQIESHSTEKQVNTVLSKKADLIVDGRRSVGELVAEILDWIQDRPSFH